MELRILGRDGGPINAVGLSLSVQVAENSEQRLSIFKEVPSQYLRSCLLSPKFFSVINRPLAALLN